MICQKTFSINIQAYSRLQPGSNENSAAKWLAKERHNEVAAHASALCKLCTRPSAMFPRRRAFVGERIEAFAPILQTPCCMEHPPLELQSLRQGCLLSKVNALLGQLRHWRREAR